MGILILDRDVVITQTVQNMIEAGVIKPEEQKMFTEQLQRLDPKDLLIALLESHNFREQAPKRVNFYPLDIDAISEN